MYNNKVWFDLMQCRLKLLGWPLPWFLFHTQQYRLDKGHSLTKGQSSFHLPQEHRPRGKEYRCCCPRSRQGAWTRGASAFSRFKNHQTAWFFHLISWSCRWRCDSASERNWIPRIADPLGLHRCSAFHPPKLPNVEVTSPLFVPSGLSQKSLTPLSAVSSQNAPQSGSTFSWKPVAHEPSGQKLALPQSPQLLPAWGLGFSSFCIFSLCFCFHQIWVRTLPGVVK